MLGCGHALGECGWAVEKEWGPGWIVTLTDRRSLGNPNAPRRVAAIPRRDLLNYTPRQIVRQRTLPVSGELLWQQSRRKLLPHPGLRHRLLEPFSSQNRVSAALVRAMGLFVHVNDIRPECFVSPTHIPSVSRIIEISAALERAKRAARGGTCLQCPRLHLREGKQR